MSDDQPPDDGRRPDTEGRIYHRQIDPTAENAEYDLLTVLAEVEGTDVTDLPAMYNSIDHFIERLFGTPPSPAAQVVLEFSYYDYRITVDQTGSVTLVKLATDGLEE
jgi:hypothetical protein